jgi:hypothetical protein
LSRLNAPYFNKNINQHKNSKMEKKLLFDPVQARYDAVVKIFPTSCNKSCGPGDYRKGGKCDLNGCYKEPKDERSVATAADTEN